MWSSVKYYQAKISTRFRRAFLKGAFDSYRAGLAVIETAFAHKCHSQAILGCRDFQLDFLGWTDNV